MTVLISLFHYVTYFFTFLTSEPSVLISSVTLTFYFWNRLLKCTFVTYTISTERFGLKRNFEMRNRIVCGSRQKLVTVRTRRLGTTCFNGLDCRCGNASEERHLINDDRSFQKKKKKRTITSQRNTRNSSALGTRRSHVIWSDKVVFYAVLDDAQCGLWWRADHVQATFYSNFVLFHPLFMSHRKTDF